MPTKKRAHEDSDEGARKRVKQSRSKQTTGGSALSDPVDAPSDSDIFHEMASAAAPREDSESFKVIIVLPTRRKLTDVGS